MEGTDDEGMVGEGMGSDSRPVGRGTVRVSGDPEKIVRLLVQAARQSGQDFQVNPVIEDGQITGYEVVGELGAVNKALRYRKEVDKAWESSD